MASAQLWTSQAAAIPFRDGQICLVRSSSGKRWIVPKGCVEQGWTLAETALQEAWEEAGLAGTLESDPVGTYCYEKLGGICHVTVFVMNVHRVAEEWPEMLVRPRRWMTPKNALKSLREPRLREIIHDIVSTERPQAAARASRNFGASLAH
jgi:8-oxo-dGTP pyrophosphatase MutT (NUDIX family)